MPQTHLEEPSTSSLVIILSSAAPQVSQAAVLALRYAATAAAMDVAVELHAVSADAAQLFGKSQTNGALLAHVRAATEQGASLYVCPLALAEKKLRAEDLIDEVSEVRGAASLIAAGFMPGARFLNF
jgi:predicted peroxiredoxin